MNVVVLGYFQDISETGVLFLAKTLVGFYVKKKVALLLNFFLIFSVT